MITDAPRTLVAIVTRIEEQEHFCQLILEAVVEIKKQQMEALK